MRVAEAHAALLDGAVGTTKTTPMSPLRLHGRRGHDERARTGARLQRRRRRFVVEERHAHAHLGQDPRIVARSKPTRTLTVAFARSAVGMIAITCAGMLQSGYAFSFAVARLTRVHAIDEVLAHVDLDFERVHVDDRADARAREAAARGDRRHHLAFLRGLDGHDARERRAHHGVVEIPLGDGDAGVGDLDHARRDVEPGARGVVARLRRIEASAR